MKHLLYILITLMCFSTQAQQTDFVDFKKANALLGINPNNSSIGGKVWYVLDVIKETDSIYIDAVNMDIKNVEIRYENSNTQDLDFYYDNKRLWLIHDFKKNKKYTVYFDYEVIPKKALYFVERESTHQIWTQGQGKYTSNWLPSIDDMNEKMIFNISLTFNEDYKVISNGLQTANIPLPGMVKWHFQMQKPMSSYLVALAIGKYDKKELTSKSGIPIELYYYPEDSSKVEPTYRYTKQMFDFLEEEIGVPYPWQNYKQVPVKDFLYSGMENTSLTIFSDDFMIDETAFIDKNYVNVNAHELAHQWFGDLVTETEGKHHWLQEGFATYYALLAERDIFGDDYYYWRLYEYALELLAQEQAGQNTPLMDPKASSATFYKKGAWLLHMLRDKVGDEAFKKAVKSYLQKYKFKNVKTNYFIQEIEDTSGISLTKFVDDWLLSDTLLYNEMETHLSTVSNAVNGYLKIDCEGYSSKCSEYLTSYLFDESKVKVIEQMPNKIQSKDFKNSIKVRQAIAQNVTKIPLELKAQYESLLNDKSYLTIEAALYHLWLNFPKERKKYLDKTKDIIGFNNKNIKTLWLVLALNTQGYRDQEKQFYYNELVDYTSSKNGFQLRQNTFSYLNSINAFNETALTNLINASKHHNWRFKSFARDLLKSLSENEKYKKIITNLQSKDK
ncbi:M1 family metallopeptidase [uncultured Lacinutrix sp.]|uniref:M1 family metallopeptidase n=1 Tax=uncultured Lacinutrix sp. TaxID=574032 RepID=UPI00261E6413|nr:M1 family metallopeptidase [uncultured Lacinutrix sp.]